MEEYGVNSVIYTEPHYSNRADIPPRAKMFAGRMFNLRGNGVKELEEFESSFEGKAKGKARVRDKVKGGSGWEYAPLPPRLQTVTKWCEEEDALQAEQCESPRLDEFKLISSSTGCDCYFSTSETNSEKQVRVQVFAEKEDQGNGERASEYVCIGSGNLWWV
jgi:hypothetical protein